MVQIIVPAAGMGKRLKSINPLSYPKLLIKLCGKTIFERLMDTLNPLEDKEFIFILGAKADILRNFIEENINIKATFLYNEHFEKTNCAYSLAKALPLIKNDWLYINSDLVFEKEITLKLQNYLGENKICVNFGVQTDLHKFSLNEENKIKDWYPFDYGQTSKEDLANQPKTDGEIVGPILCNPNLAKMLLNKYKSFDKSKQKKLSCYTLFSLVSNNNFSVLDITKNLWKEIDTEEDFRIAENLINANKIFQ